MKKKLIILTIILIGISITTFIIYTNTIYNQNIPVLAYHDVVKNPENETDISIENFEQQMNYLKQHHYKTLSLDEFYDWKKGKTIKGKKVVLTFDDGKESFYKTVVPILEKYDFKAVNFVIQSAINEKEYMNAEQLEDLKSNHPNINIESHSYNLHNEESATSNQEQIYKEDMNKNKENNYKFYAYPFGISNDSYIQALKENNYKLAFKFSPSKWANKKQNDYEITRVPIYRGNSLLKFKLKLLLKLG